MSWETPTFEEINMSAEVTAYQGDFDGDDHRAPEQQSSD